MKLLCALIILLASAFAAAQARPYPGPDLPQLYQHYLDVVNNIPAFDHHAHPGFADDADVDAMAAPPGSSAFRERDVGAADRARSDCKRRPEHLAN